MLREKGSCKEKKKSDEQTSLLELMSKQMEQQNKQIQEMKQQHTKEIEKLLEKVGNTTNIENQQNNITININNYGKENLDYITDDYLSKLLKIPYGSVPKLIKHIHFNPAHPENHNIKITNKKLPYASVFNNDKWEVQDKKRVIEDMVDKSYNMIDSCYEDGTANLSDNQKKRFKNFQSKYDTDEKS